MPFQSAGLEVPMTSVRNSPSEWPTGNFVVVIDVKAGRPAIEFADQTGFAEIAELDGQTKRD